MSAKQGVLKETSPFLPQDMAWYCCVWGKKLLLRSSRMQWIPGWPCPMLSPGTLKGQKIHNQSELSLKVHGAIAKGSLMTPPTLRTWGATPAHVDRKDIRPTTPRLWLMVPQASLPLSTGPAYPSFPCSLFLWTAEPWRTCSRNRKQTHLGSSLS